MNTTKDKIKKITTNGYELDFGTVFELAFDNYKKIAVYAGSMLLIFTFLFVILLFGSLIAVFGMEALSDFFKTGNLKPETHTGNFMIIYTGFIILVTCLLSPFQAGFLKMADCAEKGEEFHVSTMFGYYKPAYFVNIVVSTLLITLTSSGLSKLVDFAGLQSIGILISLSITLLTFLTIPLIVFGNLNAIDAIKSSLQIIMKQPLLILGLIIVAFIASLTGLLGICIGIFFTLPFMYSMEYSIYKSIIGIDFVSKIDESGSNV